MQMACVNYDEQFKRARTATRRCGGYAAVPIQPENIFSSESSTVCPLSAARSRPVTGILLQATGKRPYSRRDRPAILTAAIASRAAIWRGRTRGELARKAEGPPGRRTVAHRAGGAAITYVARPGNAAEPRIVPVRMGREIRLAPPARLSTELPFAQRAPGTNVFPHVRAFPHVVVFPHFRRVHMPQTSRAVLACCSSGRGDLCSAICARSVPTGVGAAMRSPGKRLGQGGEVRTTPETRPRRERNQSAS